MALTNIIHKEPHLKRLFLFSLLGLTACTLDTELLKAMAQPAQPPKTMVDKANQKGSASRYSCKDEKVVRVVRVTQSSKNTKKVKTDEIQLTFEDVSQKLNATLSQTGKSYTNIHWHWFDKGDSKILLDSVGRILAEGCVKE